MLFVGTMKINLMEPCVSSSFISIVPFTLHLQAGWINLNSSLRGNLRRLSKSLVFESARNPELKLTFDTVMSQAKNATVGMYLQAFHLKLCLNSPCLLYMLRVQTSL